MHIVVAVIQERVPNRAKDPRLVAAKMVVKNEIEGFAGLRLIPVVPERIVPAAASGHLLRGQAEQKEIFLPGLFGHLDRGPVAGTDRQSAVYHELHVAGAAGFVAGGGNLLGDVACRDQALG
jgi:hypothetical protein